ncbi:Major sperm protein [Aphelenchoides besseyi]|nr:Major sperm protein [Aphelenchoides besseyi]
MAELPLKLEPSDRILFASAKLGEEAVNVTMKITNPTADRYAFKLGFNAGKSVPDSGKHYFAVYAIKAPDESKTGRMAWAEFKGDPDGQKKLYVDFKKEDEKAEAAEDAKKDEPKPEEKKPEEKPLFRPKFATKMNSNVGDNNDGLPPFASSSGFADSRKRLRDSTDDVENIVPKRTVLTENSYNRQSFQPVTQSTPQNLGHYQPSFPLIPNLQAGFFENYGIGTQWPNHTYPPYQPQLSTQHLANNSLPMSSTPMQPTSLFAQNNTFDSGVYTDSSSTLNSSSTTANDLFGNFPKQMASQNHNIKTKDDVLFQIPGRLGLLNENKKYQITISEIKRRLSAPETLNISYINGIIRKAKGQDAGRALKQKLAEHGVEVSAGQRVNVKPNCFIPLCEVEAMQMADDLKLFMFKQFPTNEVRSELRRSRRRNRLMYSQMISRIRECRSRPNGLSAVFDILFEVACQEMYEILDKDQSLKVQNSLQFNYHKEHMNSDLPKSLQDKLWDFNMVIELKLDVHS